MRRTGTGKTVRVDRVLSNSGYGTRKEIKKLIRDGSVKVDGSVIKDGGMHVNPVTSVIEINGEALRYREFVYIMMNKPAGIISATYDDKLKTVLDILPAEYKCYGLFPVGRLDVDTEGLLILTNDGALAHELLSPKKHVRKRYYALVEGAVGENDRVMFKNGVVLDDGYRTLPADLNILRAGDCSEIEMDIIEGKFHQVKRMFAAVGKRVKYLRRLEMGRIKLDESLRPGEWREMTAEEVFLLRESVRKK